MANCSPSTGLADRIDNLTQALDAVAAKSAAKKKIRALKRRETTGWGFESLRRTGFRRPQPCWPAAGALSPRT
jgi:hypothetical protein